MTKSMHTSRLLGITAAGIAVVACVFFAQVSFPGVVGPAQPDPSRADTELIGSLDLATLNGDWIINGGAKADSKVGLRAGGTANGSSIEIRSETQYLGGWLRFDEAELISGAIGIDTTSMVSDNRLFLEESLRPYKIPEARFELTEPATLITDGSSLPAQQLAGSLSLNGISRPVVFEVRISNENDALTLTGTIPVDHTDFDMNPNFTGIVFDEIWFLDFRISTTRAAK